MKIIAFIPARKGSKRILDKNIKVLAGKPLIAWTIDAALNADLDMDIVVSTDCEKIAQIAQAYGAEVPFLRPESLAGDHTATFDALQYTLERLQQSGRKYHHVVLLQPTSPLREDFHIVEAVNMLKRQEVNSVVSVSELNHPIEWTMPLPANQSLDGFVEQQLQKLKTRSQDAPKHYRLNGAIYCARTNEVLLHKSFYMPKGTFAYVMDKLYATDIDDLLDFEYAEFLIGKGSLKREKL